MMMKISGLFTVLTAFFLSFFFSSPSFAAPTMVEYPAGAMSPGSIVIHARTRQLFLIVDEQTAIRYPIAVPAKGKSWSGMARVDGKYEKPAWSPPREVKRANPHLPDYIAGGAPNNPMGAAALTLDRHEIAIHGTTQAMRDSIGTAASFGCIRMYNEDILDLYSRVEVGALVIMKR